MQVGGADADTRKLLVLRCGTHGMSCCSSIVGIARAPVYRQCAIAYTDFGSPVGPFNQERHQANDEETGKTGYVSRHSHKLLKAGKGHKPPNNTLRQWGISFESIKVYRPQNR